MISQKTDESISAISPVRMQLNQKLAEDLMPILNEVHGKKLSLRFWKIILNSYINSAITVKYFFDRENVNTPPNIIAINSFTPLSYSQKLKANLVRYVKFAMTFNNYRLLKQLLVKNNRLSLSFPKMKIITSEVGENIPTYNMLYLGKGNTDARKKLNRIAERYDDLFQKNLIKQIPLVYVEYFEMIYNKVPVVNPLEKEFHVCTVQSVFIEFLIGRYVEEGAKLYWYQHGSCYGEMTNHFSHYIENNLSDEFRTWGWKIFEKDTPWKAYRLEKFKQDYDKEKIKQKFDCLLCYSDIYEGNIDFLKNVTNLFLTQCNPSKYKTFVARPRPLSRIESQKSKLTFINDSRVKKETGLGSMTKSVKSSKLIIQFMVPGTNFLECIYVDHPTMGILFNDYPTEIIKPYYDFFIKQGVLHNNFESLINHMNRIDIEQWWNELIKQPLYVSFKETFTKKYNENQ